MQGCWEFFPSVDHVIEQIERIQEERQLEAANRDWEAYKAQQKNAQEMGLLASEEDYEEMRQALRRIFGDPNVKPEKTA